MNILRWSNYDYRSTKSHEPINISFVFAFKKNVHQTQKTQNLTFSRRNIYIDKICSPSK